MGFPGPSLAHEQWILTPEQIRQWDAKPRPELFTTWSAGNVIPIVAFLAFLAGWVRLGFTGARELFPDLQARLGVSVDWQRYSWVELEALRRTLLSFENGGQRNQPLPPPSNDALVQPKFKPTAARVEPKARLSDPDAIIRPTFAAA